MKPDKRMSTDMDWRMMAQANIGNLDGIKVDGEAKIKRWPTEGGAWVQAWVWVESGPTLQEACEDACDILEEYASEDDLGQCLISLQTALDLRNKAHLA